MTTVEFEHYFGEDNCLLVTAEVTLGKPARLDCAPEDAEEAIEPEVEIISCNLIPNDTIQTPQVKFRPDGLYTLTKWGYRTLTGEIKEAAYEHAADTQE